MLKSDTISRVTYQQLAAAPPLPERQQTDVPLALMKETTKRAPRVNSRGKSTS